MILFIETAVVLAGIALAGTLAKLIWPGRAKQIDKYQGVFEQGWQFAEGLGIAKGLTGPQKEGEYLEAVKASLQARGVQTKNWMRDAALVYARQRSQAAKASAISTGNIHRL